MTGEFAHRTAHVVRRHAAQRSPGTGDESLPDDRYTQTFAWIAANADGLALT
ncbi:hypothetical protein ncot_14595 [Nocardioides sp. JQ2195]|uniref:hypothetical protein n=1 Tax=Nocardioides sp. JQ2195 TaxID=2592334 RepID=UPI00143EB203|nr:hypothetical protein [Nocardioides sp. JQ2195]QIX27686.1 hypothetical protein ncot_14595 [Nocardioides sp. JQ2195]